MKTAYFIVFLTCTGLPVAHAQDSLDALCQDYWEAHLRRHPTTATSLGDHRYDNLLMDNSPTAYVAWEETLAGFLERAEALDGPDLSQRETVTIGALIFELRSAIATLQCGMYEWNVGPLSGPQSDFFSLPSITTLTDPASGRDMAARWKSMAPYTRQHMKNLHRGVITGKFAPKALVQRVIEQIDDLEKRPVDEWALLKNPIAAIPEDWPEADKEQFKTDLRAAVADAFKPALLEYRAYLKKEILPKARNSNEPGLFYVPDGADCYDKLIFNYTSLQLDPRSIHQTGLDEVERINEETRALGRKALGSDNLTVIHDALRNDSDLHFKTRDEVEAKAVEALARARAAVPDWFGIVPRTPCEVTRMEPYEEKHSTIAYYRRPAPDGSRPGRYYINTYAPETRPRYEAEALAFHEAIPGHHLQIAIAQELTGLPEFRKHQGATAFIEGWGLYTERLSNEMGLYSSDLDRMGMLSYDSWRACRLVVDTGLHFFGWTRQKAIDFMMANSCLAKNNIENEVDRYISTPGQALAYKIGQQEILRLRREAEAALGPRFDIKAFHDTVLQNGAVDLPTLSVMVSRWIQEVQSN